MHRYRAFLFRPTVLLSAVFLVAFGLPAEACESCSIDGTYLITCEEAGSVISMVDSEFTYQQKSVELGGFGEISFQTDTTNSVTISQESVSTEVEGVIQNVVPDFIPEEFRPIKIQGTFSFEPEELGEGAGKMELTNPLTGQQVIARFKVTEVDENRDVQKLFLTIPCLVPVKEDFSEFASVLVRASANRIR